MSLEQQATRSSRQVIDPHCHFWDLSLGYHGWISPRVSDLLGDITPLCQDYLPSQYLAEANHYPWDLVQCVHVEAVSSTHALDEIAWLVDKRLQHPQIAGVVAGIDFFSDTSDILLAKYAAYPWIKGVRHLVNWHQKSQYAATVQQDCLCHPKWLSGFKQLAKYGLSFDMQLCPGQMIDAYRVALAYPDISIIINHAGMPIADETTAWREGIKLLATCANISIKLSGFGMLDRHWNEKTIRPIINHIIDCFGVNRCLFASNFPVDRLYRSFHAMFDAYLLAVSHLSDDEQHGLFHDNAKRIYRLDSDI